MKVEVGATWTVASCKSDPHPQLSGGVLTHWPFFLQKHIFTFTGLVDGADLEMVQCLPILGELLGQDPTNNCAQSVPAANSLQLTPANTAIEERRDFS